MVTTDGAIFSAFGCEINPGLLSLLCRRITALPEGNDHKLRFPNSHTLSLINVA